MSRQRCFVRVPERTRCALCLTETKLCRSHILSKFAYKEIRRRGAQPLVIEDNRAFLSDKEGAEWMLCQACEARFQTAETYVAPLLRQDSQGIAPIQGCPEVVRASNGDREMDAQHLDLEKLRYFGSSLVWRCHASGYIKHCNLGERYGEQFRTYLLGTSTFPENAALVAIVLEKERALLPLSWSSFETRLRTSREHSVCLSGLRFHLEVGQSRRTFIDACALTHGRIFAQQFRPEMDYVRFMGGARPVGKFASRRGSNR